MAAPIKVYAQRWDVNFKADEAEALRTEALLRGVSVGDVVRAAVAAYLNTTGEADS